MDSAVEKQARGARTQSLFRGVNQRVREINETFSQFVPLGDRVWSARTSARQLRPSARADV